MELIVTVQDKKTVRASRSGDAQSPTGELNYDDLILETIEIFRDWLSRGKIENRREIEILGIHLYRMLFGEEINKFFERTLLMVKDGETLRLKLQFQEAASELASLPWEYLYLPGSNVRKGYFLSTEVDLVLSRWMPLEEEAERVEAIEEPLRVLLVIAEPKTDHVGNVFSPVAAQEIIDNMNELAEEHNIELTVEDKPTVDRFRDAIRDNKPHVLHFIGHGRAHKSEHGRGEVALLDDDLKTGIWCPEQLFADYLGKRRVRIVFLHLCQSAEVDIERFHASFAGLAPQLILANIQAVVATQFPIANPDARTFIRVFYGRLAKGEPVDFAVQAGRRRISQIPKAYNKRVFGTPVLFMHRQDGVIKPVTEKEIPVTGGSVKASGSRPERRADGQPETEAATESQPKTILDVVNVALLRADEEGLSKDQREPVNSILQEFLSNPGLTPDEMREKLGNALIEVGPEVRPVITAMIQEVNKMQVVEA